VQNGNKSFAKETTAEQLKMTEKTIFHLKSAHHSFLVVIAHLGCVWGAYKLAQYEQYSN